MVHVKKVEGSLALAGRGSSAAADTEDESKGQELSRMEEAKMWHCMAPEGEACSNPRQCAAQRLKQRARNHFVQDTSKPWACRDPHGVYSAADPAPDFDLQQRRFVRNFEGDLLKQGHVRKNWKGRFFQLDEDFLKYYEILAGSGGVGGGSSRQPRRGLARSQQFTKSQDFSHFTVPVSRSMRISSGSIAGAPALLEHGLGRESSADRMGAPGSRLASGLELKGQIALSEVTQISVSQEKPFCFEVVAGSTSYLLVAANVQDRDRWMDAIAMNLRAISDVPCSLCGLVLPGRLEQAHQSGPEALQEALREMPGTSTHRVGVCQERLVPCGMDRVGAPNCGMDRLKQKAHDYHVQHECILRLVACELKCERPGSRHNELRGGSSEASSHCGEPEMQAQLLAGHEQECKYGWVQCSQGDGQHRCGLMYQRCCEDWHRDNECRFREIECPHGCTTFSDPQSLRTGACVLVEHDPDQGPGLFYYAVVESYNRAVGTAQASWHVRYCDDLQPRDSRGVVVPEGDVVRNQIAFDDLGTPSPHASDAGVSAAMPATVVRRIKWNELEAHVERCPNYKVRCAENTPSLYDCDHAACGKEVSRKYMMFHYSDGETADEMDRVVDDSDAHGRTLQFHDNTLRCRNRQVLCRLGCGMHIEALSKSRARHEMELCRFREYQCSMCSANMPHNLKTTHKQKCHSRILAANARKVILAGRGFASLDEDSSLLQQEFNEADSIEADGELEFREFKQMIEKFSRVSPEEPPTEGQIRQMFSLVDTDQSGTISWPEFQKHMPSLPWFMDQQLKKAKLNEVTFALFHPQTGVCLCDSTNGNLTSAAGVQRFAPALRRLFETENGRVHDKVGIFGMTTLATQTSLTVELARPVPPPTAPHRTAPEIRDHYFRPDERTLSRPLMSHNPELLYSVSLYGGSSGWKSAASMSPSPMLSTESAHATRRLAMNATEVTVFGQHLAVPQYADVVFRVNSTADKIAEDLDTGVDMDPRDREIFVEQIRSFLRTQADDDDEDDDDDASDDAQTNISHALLPKIMARMFGQEPTEKQVQDLLRDSMNRHPGSVDSISIDDFLRAISENREWLDLLPRMAPQARCIQAGWGLLDKQGLKRNREENVRVAHPKLLQQLQKMGKAEASAHRESAFKWQRERLQEHWFPFAGREAWAPHGSGYQPSLCSWQGCKLAQVGTTGRCKKHQWAPRDCNTLCKELTFRFAKERDNEMGADESKGDDIAEAHDAVDDIAFWEPCTLEKSFAAGKMKADQFKSRTGGAVHSEVSTNLQRGDKLYAIVYAFGGKTKFEQVAVLVPPPALIESDEKWSHTTEKLVVRGRNLLQWDNVLDMVVQQGTIKSVHMLASGGCLYDIEVTGSSGKRPLVYGIPDANVEEDYHTQSRARQGQQQRAISPDHRRTASVGVAVRVTPGQSRFRNGMPVRFRDILCWDNADRWGRDEQQGAAHKIMVKLPTGKTVPVHVARDAAASQALLNFDDSPLKLLLVLAGNSPTQDGEDSTPLVDLVDRVIRSAPGDYQGLRVPAEYVPLVSRSQSDPHTDVPVYNRIHSSAGCCLRDLLETSAGLTPIVEVAGFQPFVWVLRRSAVSSDGKQHELRDDESDGDFAGGEFLKVELHDAHGPQWRQFEPTAEDTVLHIKNTLHEKYGILPEQQRLSFAGRPLLDMWEVKRNHRAHLRKSMMSDYGIHRESVVLLSVCPIVASWSRERSDASQVKHTVPAQVISCKFDRPDHDKLRAQLLASKPRIQDMFQRIDTSGNGDLDGEELAAMYYAVTSIQKVGTVHRMTQMIDLIEDLQHGGTKNGQLDFKEFWSAICPGADNVDGVTLTDEHRDQIWTEFPELLHLVSDDLDWAVELLLPKMPDSAFKLFARVKANNGWSSTGRLDGDGGVPEAGGHTLVARIRPTPKIFKSPSSSRLYATPQNSKMQVKGLYLAPTSEETDAYPRRYWNQIFVKAERTPDAAPGLEMREIKVSPWLIMMMKPPPLAANPCFPHCCAALLFPFSTGEVHSG